MHGSLSYNNLLMDAAVQLMEEFTHDGPTFAILKHNNACGCATRNLGLKRTTLWLETPPVPLAVY